MSLPIIYEDKDILAINKPAGISVHPTKFLKENFEQPAQTTDVLKSNKEETIVDLLLKMRPEIKNVGEDILRPGLAHRLDRDTSGILIIAKNNKIFKWLKNEFKFRRVEKKYLALVWGEMPSKKGVIETPIGSAKKDIRIKITPKKGREIKKTKTAETYWRVKKIFNKYTLLEVFPRTGRTHQIRVHLSSIGHPIVCDSIYGPKKPCPSELGRQFLHAAYLKIRLAPNRVIALEAELPDDLKNFLKTLPS